MMMRAQLHAIFHSPTTTDETRHLANEIDTLVEKLHGTLRHKRPQ